MLTSQTKFKDWNDKIFVVDTDKFESRYSLFDRSITFHTGLANVNTILRAQKRLNLKGYHKTQIRISNRLFSYRASRKFLFFERFNEIIHRIQSAGLYSLWERQGYAVREKNILKTNLEHLRIHRQTDNETSFQFPIFIVYGWLTGILLLIIEIICKHFKIAGMMRRFLRISVGKLVKPTHA